MNKYINVEEAKTILFNHARKVSTTEAYMIVGIFMCLLDGMQPEKVVSVDQLRQLRDELDLSYSITTKGLQRMDKLIAEVESGAQPDA